MVCGNKRVGDGSCLIDADVVGDLVEATESTPEEGREGTATTARTSENVSASTRTSSCAGFLAVELNWKAMILAGKGG